MQERPIIETNSKKLLSVSIRYVYKANFNDTYYLEEINSELSDIDRESLTWFDPYNGRSNNGNTLFALSYCSDEKLVILKKENGVIEKLEAKGCMECIICEDHDESRLLAAHISLK